MLNDSNGEPDVFMRELATGRTTRVSVANGGGEGNGPCSWLALSGNGAVVVFSSGASNLVANDTNNSSDVFVHEPDACPAPVPYCQAKLNSLGCLPAVGATGIHSTTTISGFVITDTNVRNNKPGLLLYSLTGRNDLPFQGGRLCIASTIRRTPGVQSGGTPAPAQDCSGAYSIDFATFAAGFMGGSPPFELRIPGTKVNCQWWGRDPGFPAPLDTSLSDGLEFFMCP
ncbi:MAG: hypothetical protein IPK67_08075 [Planctomycetes bacterium]|nr:hypothetical protein [Planctomycetota bacterium]